MRIDKDAVRDAMILHGMVLGTWASFNLARRCSKGFRRALGRLESTYQFRTGSEGRWLRISKGRVETVRGFLEDPDYELVLLDAFGVSRRLIQEPNDMMQLLFENKIEQRGNTYYLFELGYLLGICSREISDIVDVFRGEVAKHAWIRDVLAQRT